jgi:5'-nucleotidase
MVLGNHEFDAGDDKLGAFLKNLTFPIISANIQSDHPVLNSTIKPFQIYEKHQLAVIGVTTEETSSISNPGKGTRFSDPVTAVQATIDFIKATTNITRFAAITHIGYEEDKKLAAETTGLHLIMGGHSHTLLGDGPNAAGSYPTIVDNKDGDEVFIVTAYSKYSCLYVVEITNPLKDGANILGILTSPMILMARSLRIREHLYTSQTLLARIPNYRLK